jgi:hypothetical protein
MLLRTTPVWFGTLNEAHRNDELQSDYLYQSISDQQLATYNAIRNTGNNSIIMMGAGVASGNPGTIGADRGFVESYYVEMKNIVWGLHFYNRMTGYSTNLPDHKTLLKGDAEQGNGFLAFQTIESADGIVPVIVGETGLHTRDPNDEENKDNENNGSGEHVLTAAFNATTQYTSGVAVRHWFPSEYRDDLTDNEGNLTDYGQRIADLISDPTGRY